MSEETKVFTKEAVFQAIKLTAFGSAGVQDPAEAKAILESIPEELGQEVMMQTVLAHKKQKLLRAKAMMAALGQIIESEKAEG